MTYAQYSSAADAPALDAIAITPGASPLPRTVRGIFVGGAGDVTVTTWGGTSITFTLPAGALLPLVCTHVTAATATGIRGLI